MENLLPDCDDYILRSLVRRDLEVRLVVAESAVELMYRSRIFKFPADALPLIRYVVDADGSVTIGEFYKQFSGEFEREELEVLLSDLAKNGFVCFRAPGRRSGISGFPGCIGDFDAPHGINK
jgi:hypothetical protein